MYLSVICITFFIGVCLLQVKTVRAVFREQPFYYN